MPEVGPLVTVQVEDSRRGSSGKGIAGHEIGTKMKQFGKPGTVDLKDKELLADHIGRDLVALLREHGYRANDVRELPVERADVAVTVEIMEFDVGLGFYKFRGASALRLRALRLPSRDQVWQGVVNAESSSANFLPAVSAYDSPQFQEFTNGLYQSMFQKLREQLPSAF